MPQAVLVSMGEKAASQATNIADQQTFKDQLFAKVVTCPVDSQGRIVLSDELCRFAGIKIKEEVVLAGGDSKFDIWHPDAWQRQQQAAAATFETMLKNIGI